MNNNDFISMYLGDWEKDDPLTLLAITYHESCDKFDNALCPKTFGTPVTGRDWSEMNKNAMRVFNYLLVDAQILGHTEGEFRAAISKAGQNRR